MNYFLGIIGALIWADGISSIYTYTHGEKAQGQRWEDHAFRIWRCLLGIAVIVIGWVG